MAENKSSPCYCSGVGAIVIAVLTFLAMRGTITGSWAYIVVLILAILIAIGQFASLCCCSTACKPKEGAGSEPPAEQPPSQGD